MQPSTYLCSETDENALKALRHHYPEVIELGDIRDISEEKLRAAVRNKPHSTHVLSFGGSPSQGQEAVLQGGPGWQGRRLSPWMSMEFLEAEVLPMVFPAAQLARGLENLSTMPIDRIQTVSDARDQIPYKLCASAFAPIRRPRLYWLSWDVTVPGLNCTECEFWKRLRWEVPYGLRLFACQRESRQLLHCLANVRSPHSQEGSSSECKWAEVLQREGSPSLEVRPLQVPAVSLHELQPGVTGQGAHMDVARH